MGCHHTPPSIHVQYSQPDSSGQNLESSGVSYCTCDNSFFKSYQLHTCFPMENVVFRWNLVDSIGQPSTFYIHTYIHTYFIWCLIHSTSSINLQYTTLLTFLINDSFKLTYLGLGRGAWRSIREGTWCRLNVSNGV